MSVCVYECKSAVKCVFLCVVSWRPHWGKEGPSSATHSFTSVLLTRCSSVLLTRRSQGQRTHSYTLITGLYIFCHFCSLQVAYTCHTIEVLCPFYRKSDSPFLIYVLFLFYRKCNSLTLNTHPYLTSSAFHQTKCQFCFYLIWRLFHQSSLFIIYISISRECWEKWDKRWSLNWLNMSVSQ